VRCALLLATACLRVTHSLLLSTPSTCFLMPSFYCAAVGFASRRHIVELAPSFCNAAWRLRAGLLVSLRFRCADAWRTALDGDWRLLPSAMPASCLPYCCGDASRRWHAPSSGSCRLPACSYLRLFTTCAASGGAQTHLLSLWNGVGDTGDAGGGSCDHSLRTDSRLAVAGRMKFQTIKRR